MTTYLTPKTVVDNLLKTGVKISERTLREKARAIGAYRQVGRAMFFLPADVEKIMEPTCLNSSNAPARHSGSRAAQSTGSASKRPYVAKAPSP